MNAEKPQLNRLEIMRALKYSNWDAVYATAFAILTGGAFLTGFALYLKANDFWMGIIFSVPMLAGLFQIVSSYFVELSGNRKKILRYLFVDRSDPFSAHPFNPFHSPSSF